MNVFLYGDFKMADFRDYIGMDASAFLMHYGVGHEDGGHSGRHLVSTNLPVKVKRQGSSDLKARYKR